MTLDVEGIVYGGLDVQEALGRTRRFETLLFPLSPSHWLMRVLSTIVRTLTIDVFSRQAEGLKRDMIGPELIGCDPRWRPPIFRQQLWHQLQRCLAVPLRLHQEIKDLAFIVDGTPQIMTPTSDNDDHFIEMPIVARCGPHAA